MIKLHREDIISLVIILVTGILTYLRILTPEQFINILSVILSFYFGRMYQTHIIYKKYKSVTYISTKYKEMLKRFGTFLMFAGITLIIEKYVVFGATLTYPPLADHSLWGLLLLIAGWILLIKKEKTT